MSMSLPILPIDLQLEIFSYLPCKTIVKFMVLSHLHRSLLISLDFISKHHNKSRNKFFLLMPFSINRLCEDDDHLTMLQKLKFPFVHSIFDDEIDNVIDTGDRIIDIGNRIIGICNGIICMKIDHDIFFINPMIRYCFDLPILEDKSINKKFMCCYGFISRGLSDYLVVKIESDEGYYTDICNEGERDEPFPPRSAWIYSYVENYWRPLEIPNCSVCITTTSYNGVVYYGLLHWSARKKVENAWFYLILTFDPQTEVFGELLLPDSLANAIYYPDSEESGDFGVFVVQSSNKPLTVYSLIFSLENYCTAAVWVMDRYGITESWNQIFTFNCGQNYVSSSLFDFNTDIDEYFPFMVRSPSLLFHKSDGKLLFDAELGQKSLRSLDISHGTSTLIINHIDRPSVNSFLDPYIGYSSPSLVLLDELFAYRY